jgi:hypothetical protein
MASSLLQFPVGRAVADALDLLIGEALAGVGQPIRRCWQWLGSARD